MIKVPAVSQNNKTSAWMPFYHGSFLKKTMHLTTEEKGAYLMLILHYWQHGKIEFNPKIIKNIAQISSKKCSRVLSFFEQKDGFLCHARIDEEMEKASENKKKLSDRGKNAAAARWDATSNACALPTTCPSPSPSPSPSPVKKESPRASAFVVPEWADKSAWDEFMEIRKKLKAVNSPRALAGIVNKLSKIKDSGNSPNEAIEASIRNSWKDVYEPKSSFSSKPTHKPKPGLITGSEEWKKETGRI